MSRQIKPSHMVESFFALPNHKRKPKFSIEKFIQAVDTGNRKKVVQLLADLEKNEKTTIGGTPTIILMLTVVMQQGHESMEKHRILMLVFTMGCCCYPHILAEVKEKDHIFSTIVPKSKFQSVYQEPKSHPLRGVYDKIDKLMRSKKDLTGLEKNALLEMIQPLSHAGWGQDIKENYRFFRHLSKATGQLGWAELYSKVMTNACLGETAYREQYVQNVSKKLQKILAAHIPQALLNIILEYSTDLTDKPQHESTTRCIIS